MRLPKIIRLIGHLLLVLALAQIAFAQNGTLNGFDDYVNKALKEWEVPGVAIAIVKDDRVILAKGYGVRKLGEPAPVDERTLFAIGSSSKAFTAAAVAMLVDEGKIKWDDPVTKYLPGFGMYDPYVTRELTVRDLLTHRSGLQRGDFLWYGSELDRDEILRRARFLKPTWSLRSTFGYQNIMFLAAGQLVARVSGKSWDEFIQHWHSVCRAWRTIHSNALPNTNGRSLPGTAGVSPASPVRASCEHKQARRLRSN